MFFPARVARAIARPLCASLAAAALASGCAQQPSQPDDAATASSQPPVSASSRSAADNPALPKLDLSRGILFEFLLAEIAGQRGNTSTSVQAYADLARRTHDPRVARRATEVAIFARQNDIAIETAKIWRESEPESARALQVLAGLLINEGRLEEAEPHLKDLLATDTTSAANSFTQLARTLATAPDKQAALSVMQRLAAPYDKLPQAHYALAQAAANAAQDELALKEVRRAQDLRPDWEAAALLEAQIRQKASSDGAIASLRAYLNKYPNSRDVRLGYARLLVGEKRFSEARDEFQRLLADFPGNSDVVYSVALLSLQLNDYSLAEQNLRRLLDMDFRDKDSARLYLGQIAEEQNKLEDALKWYDEVEEGEQYLPAQVRFAQVLAKQGKLGEARDHLHSVEASNGQQRVQLILAEAQLLRDANREKEAFDLIGKALADQPEQPDLLYDYAMLAERVDRMDLLESSLRKLITIRPDHAHAYNALGYSLADRNLRLPEAHDLIEHALKLAPDDLFIVDSMGWVLYREGRLKDAISWLRKAFNGRPDAEIAAHLGEVLWVSGDRGEAEKVWREAGEKNPKSDVLTKTMQRLKK
jgi:tetratricopeptide (TPR) repeat protein